jgi:alkanesulfonate monooxygenase SsuD/methylene tetrahydromethanopterin reductase-like flavin-dependent oxidoreductase (luciferase family)
LAEAVEIIKKLWTKEKSSYQGKYFRIVEAVCEPKPRQKPHPPITVGGCGEELTLKVTARYADRCDFGYLPTIERYKHKLQVLEKHCKAAGTDFDKIEKSAWLAGQIIIASNPKTLEEKIQRLKPQGVSRDEFEKHNLIGTPEECLRRIQAYMDLGVTYFMLFFGDLPDTSGLELFAQNVAKTVA